MNIPTLPTELLIKILSVVSSPSDLYHALLCSKRFAEIARPLLYNHITIETQQQRDRLKNVRGEDKKLVQNLTIKGDGPTDVDDMEEHLKACRLGENMVEDLFSGTILDIGSLISLHIENIHSSPWQAQPDVRPQVALPLRQLSISSHQGGQDFWENVLGYPTVFPRLAYLRIESVTRFYYLDEGRRQFSAGSLPEHDAPLDDWIVVDRNESVICSNLKSIKVYAWEGGVSFYRFGSAEPITLTYHDLSKGSYWFKLGVQEHKYVRIVSDNFNDSFTSDFYDYILSGEIQPPCFLSIPAPRSSLSIELQNVLSAIENLGTDVHCDGEGKDDSGSQLFIPNYFIDHADRMSKREGLKKGEQ